MIRLKNKNANCKKPWFFIICESCFQITTEITIRIAVTRIRSLSNRK